MSRIAQAIRLSISILLFLLIVSACGVHYDSPGPLQVQPKATFTLFDYPTSDDTNYGAQAFAAPEPKALKESSSWEVKATAVIPKLQCSPNKLQGLVFWVGVYSKQANGEYHFYQAVADSKNCTSWILQISDVHILGTEHPDRNIVQAPDLVVNPGSTLLIGLLYDGHGDYRAEFTVGTQNSSVELGGDPPAHAEFGIESPRYEEGYSAAPSFQTATLDNPTVNHRPLNQTGKVTHYSSPRLVLAQSITANSNSFTVKPGLPPKQ